MSLNIRTIREEEQIREQLTSLSESIQSKEIDSSENDEIKNSSLETLIAEIANTNESEPLLYSTRQYGTYKLLERAFSEKESIGSFVESVESHYNELQELRESFENNFSQPLSINDFSLDFSGYNAVKINNEMSLDRRLRNVEYKIDELKNLEQSEEEFMFF